MRFRNLFFRHAATIAFICMVLGFLCSGYFIYESLSQRHLCAQHCNTDVVLQCYPNKAACVGKNGTYLAVW